MSSQANTDESLVQHIVRSVKNGCTRLFGCVQTADEVAKIKLKETKIAGRKKAFGVAYLDLLAANATEEELKKCIETAVADVKKTQDEIVELQKEIERVGEETKKKIIEKPQQQPSSGGATATTGATTTAAPTTSANVAEPSKVETATPVAAPTPAPETTVAAPTPAPETETPASVPEPVS